MAWDSKTDEEDQRWMFLSYRQLLADYFVLKHLKKPNAMRQQRYRDSLAPFEQVLDLFLRDPSDKRNLRRGPARWLARLG